MIKHKNNNVRNILLFAFAIAYAEKVYVLSFAYLCVFLRSLIGEHVSLCIVKKELDQLIQDGILFTRKGTYSLDITPSVFDDSVRLRKIAIQKIYHSRHALQALSYAPFIRAMAITGSVAFGSATEKSDIDLFFLVHPRRIWTARMGVLFLSACMGRRRDRTRGGKDKLCSNYFLTSQTDMPVKNIASAHLFRCALPLFNKNLFFTFLKNNARMEGFLPTPLLVVPHIDKRIGVYHSIKKVIEKVLSGTLGDYVEHISQKWQCSRLQKKIKREGGDTSHFFISDEIIALHYPVSQNKIVMTRYQDKIKEISPFFTSFSLIFLLF